MQLTTNSNLFRTNNFIETNIYRLHVKNIKAQLNFMHTKMYRVSLRIWKIFHFLQMLNMWLNLRKTFSDISKKVMKTLSSPYFFFLSFSLVNHAHLSQTVKFAVMWYRYAILPLMQLNHKCAFLISNPNSLFTRKVLFNNVT